MGAKYQNLNRIYKSGINVHAYENLKTVDELVEYEKRNPMFSIRFDRDKDYKQLPFYKYNRKKFKTKKEKLEFFTSIVQEAEHLNCTLLCSNGYQYDDIQICNFVIIFLSKQEFMLEWSTKRVSVREMYEYPTTVLKGNMKDDLKDMEWINKKENMIGKKEIEKILFWSSSLNIIGKSIEATLYEKKIGMLKQEIICWQIDEG